MEGAKTVIEFKNTCFSYGDRQVLKDFNLTVNNGERICLFGNSGVGKTTALRLILGLEKAGDNSVKCDYKRACVVFQEDRLLPFKTVKENITLFTGCCDCDDILRELGIFDVRDKYPSQLSGGMLRRVSIARALCAEADLYIFDEPFTGLDFDNISQASKLINRITQGKTVIAVLHEKRHAQLLNCEIIDIKNP